MPPPKVTNGTSMMGMPASTSIWSVQKSLAISWSFRSPGWAGAEAPWPCCGAIVLSLTVGVRPLTGSRHSRARRGPVSTGPCAPRAGVSEWSSGAARTGCPGGIRRFSGGTWNGLGRALRAPADRPLRRAEAALARRVLRARRPQVPAVEVGPEGVEEDQLGVRRLPQQEVARAVLPRAAHEQVDVGHVGLVEEPGDGRLVDLVGVQPAGGRLPGDRGDGVGDLGPAAVVHAHGQGEDVVVPRELLGDLELGDDAAPQPRTAAGPAHPDAEGVHLVAAAADDVAVEPHEEPDLVGAAPPVLGGERVRRQRLHAELDRALDAVEQRVLTGLVAAGAGQAAL